MKYFTIIKTKRLEFLRSYGAYMEKQRNELTKFMVDINKIDATLTKKEILKILDEAKISLTNNRINGSEKFYLEKAKSVIQNFLNFKK